MAYERPSASASTFPVVHRAPSTVECRTSRSTACVTICYRSYLNIDAQFIHSADAACAVVDLDSFTTYNRGKNVHPISFSDTILQSPQ